MGDDFEPSDSAYTDTHPPSNRRILWLVAILGLAGTIAGTIMISARFGTGILIGTIFAFLNYVWLQRSLRSMFSSVEQGEQPRMLAVKHFLRYLMLAAVLGIVYLTDMLPIGALILGMAGFAFATVVEGFIRIFSSIFSSKEI